MSTKLFKIHTNLKGITIFLCLHSFVGQLWLFGCWLVRLALIQCQLLQLLLLPCYFAELCGVVKLATLTKLCLHFISNVVVGSPKASCTSHSITLTLWRGTHPTFLFGFCNLCHACKLGHLLIWEIFGTVVAYRSYSQLELRLMAPSCSIRNCMFAICINLRKLSSDISFIWLKCCVPNLWKR